MVQFRVRLKSRIRTYLMYGNRVIKVLTSIECSLSPNRNTGRILIYFILFFIDQSRKMTMTMTVRDLLRKAKYRRSLRSLRNWREYR